MPGVSGYTRGRHPDEIPEQPIAPQNPRMDDDQYPFAGHRSHARASGLCRLSRNRAGSPEPFTAMSSAVKLTLYTYQDFSRSDGSPDAIAHGTLSGVVALGGSDAAAGEASVRTEGVMLSLLGTAEPSVLHEWFRRLSDGGTVVDALARKPWGASDGQVIDQHGLHWLIGYED